MNDALIKVPIGAQRIISRLSEAGYQSYVVGGCVRDSLLLKTPHDWDICTSATPEEVKAVFRYDTVFDTGIKHGTLTIIYYGDLYEVTTFRADGEYSDNRHPDDVVFVKSLKEDVARRDFTINSIAFNNESGVIDYYGGIDDLNDKVIRCVGNPDDRFKEDALRILRALRFASTYTFTIEKKTAEAIHRNAMLLNNIAEERIRDELCKMLFGDGILEILLDYSDVIATIIPEIKPCIGFEQHNRYHQYTVYDHIAHAVANYHGCDTSVKVALLLHDIGKPKCYTEDERGGHFHGHSVPSHDIAELVVNRLRFDNKTQREVLELVLYHDSVIEPQPKVVRRWLNKIGEHRFMQLLSVRMADILAHAEGTQESRIERCHALYTIARTIVAENQCFSMKDLAVNGNVIMDALGLRPGKKVGDTLRHLLDKVIAEEVENTRDALLKEALSYVVY